MKKLFVFVSVMMLTVASVSMASAVQWGEINYPIEGNLMPTSGTVLVHFVVDEDVRVPPGPDVWYQQTDSWARYVVARIMINSTHHLMFYSKAYTNPHRGEMWVQMTYPGWDEGPRPTLKSTVGGNWKPGEDHWIAYRWDQNGTHSFWIDGVKVDELTNVGIPSLGLGQIDTNAGKITLGSGGRADIGSALTILGVHILNGPLSDAELALGPEVLFSEEAFGLAADRGIHTLLLDNFEYEDFVPDGKSETMALMISGFSGEMGGVPTAATRFVDTPHGRGLQLYVLPEDQE